MTVAEEWLSRFADLNPAPADPDLCRRLAGAIERSMASAEKIAKAEGVVLPIRDKTAAIELRLDMAELDYLLKYVDRLERTPVAPRAAASAHAFAVDKGADAAGLSPRSAGAPPDLSTAEGLEKALASLPPAELSRILAKRYPGDRA